MQDNAFTLAPNHLWATTIYTARNPVHEQIVKGLRRTIYAQRKHAERAVETGIAANVKRNLYESSFDFFASEVPEVMTLKQFCGRAVLEAARHRNAEHWQPGQNFSLSFHESWFHVTRAGGYHDYHNHPNCSWCGIYYVDVGDSSLTDGCNSFFDPRIGAGNYSDYGSRYLDGRARVDFEPSDATLIIFPSYIYHSATPYMGKRDRLVVAFNASIHLDP